MEKEKEYGQESKSHFKRHKIVKSSATLMKKTDEE